MPKQKTFFFPRKELLILVSIAGKLFLWSLRNLALFLQNYAFMGTGFLIMVPQISNLIFVLQDHKTA